MSSIRQKGQKGATIVLTNLRYTRHTIQMKREYIYSSHWHPQTFHGPLEKYEQWPNETPTVHNSKPRARMCPHQDFETMWVSLFENWVPQVQENLYVILFLVKFIIHIIYYIFPILQQIYVSLDFGQVLDQNQGLVSHLQVSLAKPWPRLKFGLTKWFVSFGSFL